jgi:hypothetical protein
MGPVVLLEPTPEVAVPVVTPPVVLFPSEPPAPLVVAPLPLAAVPVAPPVDPPLPDPSDETILPPQAIAKTSAHEFHTPAARSTLHLIRNACLGQGTCPVVIPDGQSCDPASQTETCDDYATCQQLGRDSIDASNPSDAHCVLLDPAACR